MRRTSTWVTAALAVLGVAGAVVADSPSPVFVDHCFETLPGVGTRYWVAVGGNDCDDAPIRIRTGNNSSPFLPDIEATQETDGRYNVTIISELGESFLLNTYIVEPQEAGIEFNVLRVVRLAADVSHDVTLELGDAFPIHSVGLLGNIASTDDAEPPALAYLPISIVSFAPLGVIDDVQFIGANAIPAADRR